MATSQGEATLRRVDSVRMPEFLQRDSLLKEYQVRTMSNVRTIAMIRRVRQVESDPKHDPRQQEREREDGAAALTAPQERIRDRFQHAHDEERDEQRYGCRDTDALEGPVCRRPGSRRRSAHGDLSRCSRSRSV
jgi:hypothetical protein